MRADHAENLQVDQLGGDAGHGLLGIGRIVVVQGMTQRPFTLATLNVRIELVPSSKLLISMLLAEAASFQSGKSGWPTSPSSTAYGRWGRVAKATAAKRAAMPDQGEGFGAFGHGLAVSCQWSVVSCQKFAIPASCRVPPAYRKRELATPSRSWARRLKNTNAATMIGGIGGNSTARDLYQFCSSRTLVFSWRSSISKLRW